MILSTRFHDAAALALAGLVLWACLQLAGPWALPVALVGLAGCLLALLVVLGRLRERRDPDGRSVDPAPAGLDLGARPATLALWVIVAAALLLRIHTLLSRPTWADEMWTLRNIYTSSWSELFRVAFDDYWPPLHYVILNVLARVGNTGLVWLRTPSVVFGTAAVALMYPLGIRLFGNRIAGLAGAALLAGMTSHVLYSQEARVYAMLVCLTVASAYYFYRSFWERRISAGFVLVTILLTYSHSFASWYFVAGECVYVVVAGLVWRDREAFRKGFLSQLLVFVAWLPLAGAFLFSHLARDVTVPTFWATGLRRSVGLMDIVEQYQGLAVRSWAGAAFTALLFALALVALVRSRPTDRPEGPSAYRRAVVFLLCWSTVPIAFSLAVTLGTSLNTFGEIRYHLSVLPGLCLLAAGGLVHLRSRASMAAAWALMVLLPAAQLPRYYGTLVHASMDEAAQIVRAEGSPDELVYVGGSFRAFAYYTRGFFPRIGSPRWDSLTAAHAGFTGRYTLDLPQWGNTYAYEKLSPRIRTFNYYFSVQPDRFDSYVREELARGGFQGTYWLLLSLPADRAFLEAMEAAGVPCQRFDVYHIRGLELRHCGVGGGP